MIHALLFDMGNVLLHFSHERMYRQIGELVGWSAEQARGVLMDSGLFARFERGEITPEQMVGEVQRLLGREVVQEELERAGSDIFWRNESMEPVIEQLAATGLPLVLVSNTNHSHIAWVNERFEVLRHFSRRVLSFEVGACKPHRVIFQAAARLAGVAPSECFFTDDTTGHVEAAQLLGFDAVVYRDTPQLVAELAHRNLRVG